MDANELHDMMYATTAARGSSEIDCSWWIAS